MPSVNCCHVLLQPLAKNISSDTAGSIWAADVPGWITAVGTALLAVFAILTTIYAVRAFRKQSQEVSDQASMLQIQSEQLAEQRKVNTEQIGVLALQAADLRESLEERKREASARRRGQALQIQISINPFGNAVAMRATITNRSAQAVYAAELRWLFNSESSGDPNPQLLGTIPPMSDCTTERDFPANRDREAVDAILTFRDAAGITWMRRPDGTLAEQHLQCAIPAYSPLNW
jgi:hypothetical protein